jgi:signal transduction histidine kinase
VNSNMETPTELPHVSLQGSKLTDMAQRIRAELESRQLSATVQSLPIFICYHALATMMLGSLVDAPKILFQLWQAAAFVGAIIVIASLYLLRDYRNSPSQSSKLLKLLPLFGLGMAALWSIPPITFTNETSLDGTILIYGISFVMWALGLLTWLRMPYVAVLYASFVGLVMSWTIYQGLPDHKLLFALICTAFWLALMGLIVTAHREYGDRLRVDLERLHQGELIKLLLNDFEKGARDWLWETDQDGLITYYSPLMAEILSLGEDNLLETNLLDLLDPIGTSETVNSLRDDFKKLQPLIDKVIACDTDHDRRYWHLKAKALLSNEGSCIGYRGVGRDVTENHLAEAKILQAKTVAENASAAKTDFLAVISHELRTPINAIVGFSELLNVPHADLLPAQSRNAYLTSIIENAGQLQDLINDILDATRLERGTFQLTEQDNDAAEIVEAALQYNRSFALKSDVTVIAHVLDDVNLNGDLRRLKQVMVHLLSNAIKFSPAGSIVNVAMRRGPSDELIISIRDAGIGISEDAAKRVFDPFVQLDQSSTRSHGGLGLGLSIAQRIARLHGGEVTLQGLAGLGTEATLIIPAPRVTWPVQLKERQPQVAA